MRYFCAGVALVLAGCAAPAPQIQTVTVTKLVAPDVPPALLVCEAAPAVPASGQQSDAAAYVVRLWEAGQDCRLHLAAVGQALGENP